MIYAVSGGPDCEAALRAEILLKTGADPELLSPGETALDLSKCNHTSAAGEILSLLEAAAKRPPSDIPQNE